MFDNLNLGDDLTKFKKSTSDLMSDVKGSVLTPMNSITSKAKEGIALIKSTDTKLQSVISSYRSTAIEQLNGIVGALSGGLLNADDITAAVRVGPDGVTFSSDDLLRTVSSKIGIDVTSTDAFTRQFTDTLDMEFNRISGGYGDLLNSSGGAFRVNRNWRNETGSSTLDTFMRYTDAKDIIDESVTNSFYNSLMLSAADFGMADSYEDIMAKYTTPEAAQDGVVESVGRMLDNGDLVSLDSIIKLLDQSNLNAINARYPDFLEKLLSQYRFGPDVYPGDYPELRGMFNNITKSIAGPNWYKRTTQFGEAFNLGMVNFISDDMIILLQEMDEYIPMICAQGIYNDQPAMDVFYQNFPETPILTSLR